MKLRREKRLICKGRKEKKKEVEKPSWSL